MDVNKLDNFACDSVNCIDPIPEAVFEASVNPSPSLEAIVEVKVIVPLITVS